MKSADERFNEISHDCSICTRVKVDPPYAFMELELEDGTPTGDATATLTEEGMEKLIEYLRQTLDDFRRQVNERVSEGMKFSPRPKELHSFSVDFTKKGGAVCRIDEKDMRLHGFKINWEAGAFPLVHVSFFSGNVKGKFPPKTLAPWELDHQAMPLVFNEIKNGEVVEKEDGTKL